MALLKIFILNRGSPIKRKLILLINVLVNDNVEVFAEIIKAKKGNKACKTAFYFKNY